MYAPQKLCEEPLLSLLLGLVGHGDFSGYLRSHQATATSMRATVARSKPVGIRPIRGGLILDDAAYYGGGSD